MDRPTERALTSAVPASQIDDGSRWRSPGLLSPRLRLAVTRPRDHLVLHVSATGRVVVVGEDRVPRLVPAEGATRARLIVGLPPQLVSEQVLQEHISAAKAAADSVDRPPLTELDVGTMTISAAPPAIDRVRVTRLLSAAGLTRQVATMEPVARCRGRATSAATDCWSATG